MKFSLNSANISMFVMKTPIYFSSVVLILPFNIGFACNILFLKMLLKNVIYSLTSNSFVIQETKMITNEDLGKSNSILRISLKLEFTLLRKDVDCYAWSFLNNITIDMFTLEHVHNFEPIWTN